MTQSLLYTQMIIFAQKTTNSYISSRVTDSRDTIFEYEKLKNSELPKNLKNFDSQCVDAPVLPFRISEPRNNLYVRGPIHSQFWNVRAKKINTISYIGDTKQYRLIFGGSINAIFCWTKNFVVFCVPLNIFRASILKSVQQNT